MLFFISSFCFNPLNRENSNQMKIKLKRLLTFLRASFNPLNRENSNQICGECNGGYLFSGEFQSPKSGKF